MVDIAEGDPQMFTVDRRFLADRVKKLPPKRFEQVVNGIDAVLGR